MERGIINTTVRGNALKGTWQVEEYKQIQLSPLITFDAFDKFKILLFIKLENNEGVVSYFVQTKGVYGVLPKLLTILVGRDPNKTIALNFVSDTSWKKVGNEPTDRDGSNIVHFKIEIPNSNITKLCPAKCNFSSIWKQPGANVTIEASDGKQINVHKTVLLARSDVFRAIWQNEMLESKENHLRIPELDEDSLNSFVSYLYHAIIEDCDLNKCFVLLSIADKYNIKDLVMKCQNNLQQNLSKDNAIDIFLHADLHNLQTLKAHATECIIANMETVVITNAWRERVNASFLKHIYENLVKIEKKVAPVNKIAQSIEQTNYCLKVKFPINARHRSDRLYQMTISPESGHGTFILRILEHNEEYFMISICQCKYDDDFHYINVNFIGEVMDEDFEKCSWSPILESTPHIPEMIINEWYDIGLFKIQNTLLTVTLEISYDVKYNRKNCAFIELLTDTCSADMTLESSDGIFRQVHKAVLIARNLGDMVNQCDSKDHLKLCHLSTLALNEFINFIYGIDNGELHVDYCAELLNIAHEYNILELKYECETKLKTLVNTTNFLELHSLAIFNKAIFLEQCVLHYVHLNKLEIIETENWQNFNDCDLIRKLIGHHRELKELTT